MEVQLPNISPFLPINLFNVFSSKMGSSNVFSELYEISKSEKVVFDRLIIVNVNITPKA